jgi:hypothetical protein
MARKKGFPKVDKSIPMIPLPELDSEEIFQIMKNNLPANLREHPTIHAFILDYLDTRDTTQTAANLGINPATAKRLRNRKDVHKTIVALTKTACLKYDIDPETIVKRVNDIATFDPGDIIDPATGACVENIHEVPVEIRRCIKKMKVENIKEKDHNGVEHIVGRAVTVEFWDKLKASEMIGKELDLFKEKKIIELGPTKDMANLLLESRRRAEERIVDVEVKPLKLKASFPKPGGSDGGGA